MSTSSMKKGPRKIYYDVINDLQKYPQCWLYIIWSKRGAGKTYSMLRRAKEHGETFLYMKRTNKDIDFLCSVTKKKIPNGKDPSPFAPLNRDFGWNIKPIKLDEGYAAFYECEIESGEPIGDPVAYACSLNKVKDLKGFEFSFCDYMVFDEFIPQPGEVVKHAEGEMLLSLYMTISRDRQARGKDPLKLILFANAEQIVTPITQILEVIDDMAYLDIRDESHLFLPERDILLHHITQKECPQIEEEKKGIWKGMQGTAWFDKAFLGKFSGADFSSIEQNRRLTGYHCYMSVCYMRKWYFVYQHTKNNDIYITRKAAKAPLQYDLDKDIDRRNFFYYQIPKLNQYLDAHLLNSDTYSMYDVILNYRDHFKI